LQGQNLPLRQQLPLPPPPRVPTSGRSRRLYPGMRAQTDLRPPRRRRRNRLRGIPRRQMQALAQALAQPTTPARVVGPGSLNGVIEVQCKRCQRIARIAQSVTPVTVVHLTASAQSRVATLHLIVHELLAFLVVSVVIAMPAPARHRRPHCRGCQSGPPHPTRAKPIYLLTAAGRDSSLLQRSASVRCGAVVIITYAPNHRNTCETHAYRRRVVYCPPSLWLC
jgi:hypothetical protein